MIFEYLLCDCLWETILLFCQFTFKENNNNNTQRAPDREHASADAFIYCKPHILTQTLSNILLRMQENASPAFYGKQVSRGRMVAQIAHAPVK